MTHICLGNFLLIIYKEKLAESLRYMTIVYSHFKQRRKVSLLWSRLDMKHLSLRATLITIVYNIVVDYIYYKCWTQIQWIQVLGDTKKKKNSDPPQSLVPKSWIGAVYPEAQSKCVECTPKWHLGLPQKCIKFRLGNHYSSAWSSVIEFYHVKNTL